jgi:hypothetical protein
LNNGYWNIFTRNFVDKDSTHINYQSVASLHHELRAFNDCYVYGDTPFREQFAAFDELDLPSFPFRLPGVGQLTRHFAWKLLGRSVEYSSYLHAISIK